jgi:hypothetical protein
VKREDIMLREVSSSRFEIGYGGTWLVWDYKGRKPENGGSYWRWWIKKVVRKENTADVIELLEVSLREWDKICDAMEILT